MQMRANYFYPIPGSIILGPRDLWTPHFLRDCKFPPQKSSASHMRFNLFQFQDGFFFHLPSPSLSDLKNPSFHSPLNIRVAPKMCYLVLKKKCKSWKQYLSKLLESFFLHAGIVHSQALDSFLTDCRQIFPIHCTHLRRS